MFSDYLNILYLPNTSELVIFCGCFTGSCIRFLWYNSYPAKVFMGDTGSLTIGGIIRGIGHIDPQGIVDSSVVWRFCGRSFIRYSPGILL